MGLIDFVKDAGQKLFRRGRDEEEAAQNAEKAAALNAERAVALNNVVMGMGLEVNDFNVAVDGEVATVEGTTPSQAEREKIVLLVGNTAGIAQVDDQIAVVTPEPEAAFYTVERGDTLSGIAKKHYGKAMKYMVIFNANRPMLEDPDRIYPGQVLRVPPLDE